MNLNGQPVLVPTVEGSMTLSDVVNCVVGKMPTLVTRLAGAAHLVVEADQGGWHLRSGDCHAGSTPATEFPAPSASDGSAGVHLRPGEHRVFPDPAQVTVARYAADSVLTYYWV